MRVTATCRRWRAMAPTGLAGANLAGANLVRVSLVVAGLAVAGPVMTGAGLTAPAHAQSAADAQLHVRIDQLESQLRHATGQVEQLSHQVRQLEDQLRRLSEDTEFRFQELGGAGGGSSATVGSLRDNVPPPSQQPASPSGFQAQPLGPPPGASFDTSSDISSATRGAPPSNLGVLQGPLNIMPGGGGRSDGGYLNDSGNAGGGFQNQNPAHASLGVQVDPQGAYDIAYAYVLQRDYDGAEVAFRQFLQDHPDHALSGNAQFWLGETYFVRKQYREAAEAFLDGYQRYKSSPRAPESLLKLGMSLKEMNQLEAACGSLAELERAFPSASAEVKERARAEMRSARC